MITIKQRLLRKKITFSLFIAAFFLSSITSFGQGTIEVPVKLDIEKGSMDGVLVKVKKDGKDAFSQSGSGKMRFKLEYNKKYTLVFTKEGYITKTIEFDTHAPAARIKDGFEPYTIGVKLFNQEDDQHMVVYNQAVGRIRYDPVLDEFSFDTDYSKSVLSDLAENGEQKKDSTAEEVADSDSPSKKEIKERKKADEEQKQEAARQKAENDKAAREAKKQEQQKLAEEQKKASETRKMDGAEKPKPLPPQGGEDKTASGPKSGADPNGRLIGATGNDPNKPLKGNAGNDNSNLVAMADGGDPDAGLMASTGNETAPMSAKSTGSDSPKLSLSASQGNDQSNRALNSANGADSNTGQMDYESESITREDKVEDKRIVTIVRVTKRNTTTEYTRVKYRWGGPYYFIDGKIGISETVFGFYTGVKD